jgi:CheY-like chemotaxis protein
MLQRLIGEDIELVMVLGEDLGKVKVDPGQMEQVVMNLAVNARDAMPMGGRLILETSNVEVEEEDTRRHMDLKVGLYVMLSVRDTGVGIASEVREYIFEPFFTTKERGKGTGLGLSMVYGIVNQSRGFIGVESELEQGTTFKIYFPRVVERVEGLEARSVKQEMPRGSETVLVVEDDGAVRNLASQILKEQGYRILEASNGEEALSLYGVMKEPIHLVLTDVVMPRMSGRELVERLISLYPEMRVLYMSGYTDDAIVQHGVLEEGVSYIQKPFTMEGLAKKVREVLDKA